MNVLDLATLKLNLYEGEVPSDELIIKLLNELSNSDNILVELSNHFMLFFNPAEDIANRLNYIEIIYSLFKKYASNWNYTKDDEIIHKYYLGLIKSGEYSSENFMKMLEELKKVVRLTPSGEIEVYIQEKLKYLLLDYYTRQINHGNTYEAMKELLSELKNSKEAFKILQEKYDN